MISEGSKTRIEKKRTVAPRSFQNPVVSCELWAIFWERIGKLPMVWTDDSKFMRASSRGSGGRAGGG